MASFSQLLLAFLQFSLLSCWFTLVFVLISSCCFCVTRRYSSVVVPLDVFGCVLFQCCLWKFFSQLVSFLGMVGVLVPEWIEIYPLLLLFCAVRDYLLVFHCSLFHYARVLFSSIIRQAYTAPPLLAPPSPSTLCPRPYLSVIQFDYSAFSLLFPPCYCPFGLLLLFFLYSYEQVSFTYFLFISCFKLQSYVPPANNCALMEPY